MGGNRGVRINSIRSRIIRKLQWHKKMKGTKCFRVWSVKSLQGSEGMKKKQAVEFVKEVVTEEVH